MNSPRHYAQFAIQPIDAINAWGLNFNLGNAVKYIARCDHKQAALEDLKKAAFYLRHEIGRREAEATAGRHTP